MKYNRYSFWLGLGTGAGLGWTIIQQLWAIRQVASQEVWHTLAIPVNRLKGEAQLLETWETEAYTASRTLEAGIERIIYRPRQPRFQTPILMQHGMWHGAWCWRDVNRELARGGHRVHAVTLTGVGERKHLMSPLITLETHIADVMNAIEAEELDDVVLAVHSYAGMLGTAVADRLPGRLKHLVYVDAVVPMPGESWSSTHASATREARIAAAAREAGEINAGTPLPETENLIEANGRPKWRGTASLTWSLGQFQIGAFARYTGAVDETAFVDADGNPWRVKSQLTGNLYAQVRIKDAGGLGGDMRWRVGVRNITNEKPPLSSEGYLGSLYNPYGRYWYTSVTTEF